MGEAFFSDEFWQLDGHRTITCPISQPVSSFIRLSLKRVEKGRLHGVLKAADSKLSSLPSNNNQ